MTQETAKEKQTRQRIGPTIEMGYIRNLIQLVKDNQLSCLEVAGIKIINGIIEVDNHQAAKPPVVTPEPYVEPDSIKDLRMQVEPEQTPEQFKEQMELLLWSSTPEQLTPKLRQIK